MLDRIRKSRDEGFTLIELLIVIIILGILAAIVVFAVGSTRKDSVEATCKTDVQSIRLAEEAYKTKNAKYTTSTTDLADANTGYLKSWPGGTDATKDEVVLSLTGDTAAYTVGIAGKSFSGATSVPGTASDNAIATACKP